MNVGRNRLWSQGLLLGPAVLLAGACTSSGDPGTGPRVASTGATSDGPDSSASGDSAGSSGSGGASGSTSGSGALGGGSGTSGLTDAGDSTTADNDSEAATPDDGTTDADAGGPALADAGGGCRGPAPDRYSAYSASIAGTWDFTPAGGTISKIQVPGGGWVKQGFTTPSATYQTRITIPDSGQPQTTLLEFGAINHQATLSIDGTVVGTNTTSFTPSVFDVTKFVKPAQQHLITVVVNGRQALRNSSGKDTVPAAADWSPNVAQGIFRSAMVRVYPDVYVSDAFVRTSVANRSLSYDVWITNSGSAARQLTLSGTLDSWNCDALGYPALPARSVVVAAGATQKVTVGPIAWALGSTSYWWPNVPYQAGYQAKLHDLSVSVAEGGKVLHTRVVRFGFRETEQRQADTQHTYYYLNGVRVNFRGDSLQGADYDSIDSGGKGDAYDTLPGFLPPSLQNGGWPLALRNYQRLNYNVIRIHQELASPYMLDVADEEGQMIIDETAIRGTDGEDS